MNFMLVTLIVKPARPSAVEASAGGAFGVRVRKSRMCGADT